MRKRVKRFFKTIGNKIYDGIYSGACERRKKRVSKLDFVPEPVNQLTNQTIIEYERESRIAAAVKQMLEAIGEDSNREGLLKTPERVAKAWSFMFSGYGKDPKVLFKAQFAEKHDTMVVLKDIEFSSTCEHHLLPFLGKAHIAYIPRDKVCGISKLARLLEIYARRLQIQERMANQIAETLQSELNPLGCGVLLEAQHLCMTTRGVQKQNSIMVTSALRGIFLQDDVKQEFLRLIGK